jgi:hypothetical protein
LRYALGVSLLILALAPGIGLCRPPENVQDSIESLNRAILELKTQVMMQNKEIERLKRLCKKFGINPSPEDVALPATAISKPMFGVYLGETIESLEKRHRVVGFMTSCALPNSDLPGKLLFLYSADPVIDCLKVLTYQEQACQIKVRVPRREQDPLQHSEGTTQKNLPQQRQPPRNSNMA